MMSPFQVLTKNGDDVKKLRFSDCILDELGLWGDEHRVTLQFESNCIIISNASIADGKPTRECYATILKHDASCPFRQLRKNNISVTLESTSIKIATAVLVQSSDNFILLTKRPSHMRTYPGMWVPPGGHLEAEETPIEGVARELYEEIGLEVNHTNGNLHILGVWESAYPPILKWGSPNRHHLIIYFHYLANENRKQLQKKLKLDPQEVSTCAWLNSHFVRELLKATDTESFQNLIPTCEVTMISENQIQIDSVLPTGQIFSIDGFFEGRVSMGTKFALRQWLEGLVTNETETALRRTQAHL